MPSFSHISKERLNTATYTLQRLFNVVIGFYNNKIIQGWRPIKEQLELYNAGKSKVKKGKHNTVPSKAVDSGPWIPGRGIPWPKLPEGYKVDSEMAQYIKDLCQFYHYGGFVEGVAAAHNIPIRWGGDWDRDHNIADQSFNDLVHFEEVS